MRMETMAEGSPWPHAVSAAVGGRLAQKMQFQGLLLLLTSSNNETLLDIITYRDANGNGIGDAQPMEAPSRPWTGELQPGWTRV